MTRRITTGLALLAMLAAACSPDPVGPNPKSGDQPAGAPLPTSIGDPDLATKIDAYLTCLYDPNGDGSGGGLLPNQSSSTGKFKSIKTYLASNDLDSALAATSTLVHFIELKFSQYTGPATVNCNPSLSDYGFTNPVTVAALEEATVTALWEFVGLTGNVCEIPAGNPEAYCKTSDNQTAFVYFPPGLFDKLTYVGIEENPPGFTSLQNTLDEYPTYVKIVTEPISDFSGEPVKPLVVVCFNYAVTGYDQSLLARLLLGHQHVDAITGATTFGLIPPADWTLYPGVLEQAQSFCEPPPAAPPVLGLSSNTLIGRLANRVADILAPAPLQASMYALAFGGVGGSAEEFSTFGATDPALSAFGGVGGSAEEFAPPMLLGPAASTYNSGTSTVTDTAGARVTTKAELPVVKVVTPGLLTAAPGVKVYFKLLAPVTAPYKDTVSTASLCGGTVVNGVEMVETNSDGEAWPSCLDFGTKAGYQDLEATFDPSPIDPLACILDPSSGDCATATTNVNFLVRTTPGTAAVILTDMAPYTTSTGSYTPPFAAYSYPGTVTAYAKVSETPRVVVTDLSGNPVPASNSVTWTPTNSTLGNVASFDLTSSTPEVTLTDAAGRSTVSGWWPEEGPSTLSARITGNTTANPAVFSALTPTGIPTFMCELGTADGDFSTFDNNRNKQEVAWFKVPEPKSSTAWTYLYMSVTGESSSQAEYQGKLEVFRNGTSTKVGEATGANARVSLPGNNGKPAMVAFKMDTRIAKVSGTNFLYFKLSILDAPAQRTYQLWYTPNLGKKLGTSPSCTSAIYDPSGVNKPGIAVLLTN